MTRTVAAIASVAILLAITACAGFHAGPLPGAPADATFVDVDGVHVRYREAGSGPAVVLIHGFGASLDSWAGVIPELAPAPSRDRGRSQGLRLDSRAPTATTAPPRRPSSCGTCSTSSASATSRSSATRGARRSRCRWRSRIPSACARSRSTTRTSTTTRSRASFAWAQTRRHRRAAVRRCSTASASRTACRSRTHDDRCVTQARVDRVEAELASPRHHRGRARGRARHHFAALHDRARELREAGAAAVGRGRRQVTPLRFGQPPRRASSRARSS